jgi:predicted ATPase
LFGLGYPEQARQRVQEALTLARALGHPTSLGYALSSAAHIYLDRREESAIQAQAEALLDLAAEQGFALRMAQGSMGRGWVLAMQGHRKEGIAQLRQGLAAFQTSGAEFFRPFYLSLLAEACRQEGQVEEGLVVIAEALAVVEKNGERFYEAELYRLKGELLLAQEGKKKN